MWPFKSKAVARPFDKSAGPVYAALVAGELSDEWARKESLEGRGHRLFANVLLIAGAVLSITSFAFGTDRTAWPVLPIEVVAIAGEAFVFLLGAALLGIRVGWPRSYEAFSVDELRRVTTEDRFWSGRESIAVLRTTETRIDLLAKARDINHDKAWGLTYGTVLELIGIVLLAAAVATFFLKSPQTV